MVRVRRVVGGILLVLANLRLLQLLAEMRVAIGPGDVLRWSPLLLVLLGLAGIVRLLDARQSFRGPLLVLALGAALLCVTVEPLRAMWGSAGWAVAALVAGWWLAASPRRGADLRAEDWPRMVCVLESKYRISGARHLHNGTVHAVLGGLTFDLRTASVSAQGARIDVTAVFGGVDLVVPPSWEIDFRPKNVGGVCRSRVSVPATAAGTGPRVEIHCLSVLGGIEIRAEV